MKHDVTEEPKEYTLRSLRDIYELPTDEMVERCMKELSALMVITRNTGKLLNGVDESLAAEEERPPLKMRIQWPDETVWRDDNGGTSRIQFMLGGEEVLTVDVTHRKHRKRKRNV